MSNIIGYAKNDKHCPHFIPLKDGTKTGDPKYCDLSLECRQMGMRSDWHRFKDMITQEERFDYFCTGFYPAIEERTIDVEVS